MTIHQLLKTCSKHPYILVRHEQYGLVGVNSKVAMIRLKKKVLFQETYIQSFQPCTFNQYISMKNPFL